MVYNLPELLYFRIVPFLGRRSLRKMHKLLPFLTAVFIFLTIACNQDQSQVIGSAVKNSSSENTDLTFLPTPDSAVAASLDAIRKFAEKYEPRSSDAQTIPSAPEPNEKLSKALDDVSRTQTREHEKYIVLIFLKLDRFQIEHFKQRYEIGNGQLAKEFYLLIGDDPKPGGEPRLTYEAETWIE